VIVLLSAEAGAVAEVLGVCGLGVVCGDCAAAGAASAAAAIMAKTCDFILEPPAWRRDARCNFHLISSARDLMPARHANDDYKSCATNEIPRIIVAVFS
jgi:hypothetical protein